MFSELINNKDTKLSLFDYIPKATIGQLCRKTYESRWYKIIFFISWPISHIVFHYLKYDNFEFNVFLEKVFFYEIYWYLSVGLIIVSPWLLMRYVLKDLNLTIDFCPETNNWAFRSYVLYSFFAVVLAINVFLGYIEESNQLMFRYHKIYPVVLYVITMLFFTPSFFNVFLVISSFWNKTKKDFQDIKEPKDLFKLAECVYVFHNINLYLLFAHAFYLFCIFQALVYSELISLADITKIINSKKQSELILSIIYLTSPLLIPTIYYIFIIREFKKIITDGIIKSNPNDMEINKIQMIFYDKKSIYCLYDIFTYYGVTSFISFIATIYPLIKPTINK